MSAQDGKKYRLFKDGSLVRTVSGWSVEGCADFVVDQAYYRSKSSPNSTFTVQRGDEPPIYTVVNGKTVGQQPVVDGDNVVGYLPKAE